MKKGDYMTLGYSLKRLASLIAMAIIGTSVFVGCSDDKGGGGTIPTAYSYHNGQCVDQNNNPVPYTYCNNNNNGICYNQNGQQTTCTNNNGGICYNQYGQQVSCGNNNGGICYNQYGQQVSCGNSNGGICYNQYGQQVSCSNSGGGSTSCSNGVFIYPYGCLPRDGCPAGHVRWNGVCTYVGQ